MRFVWHDDTLAAHERIVCQTPAAHERIICQTPEAVVLVFWKTIG